MTQNNLVLTFQRSEVKYPNSSLVSVGLVLLVNIATDGVFGSGCEIPYKREEPDTTSGAIVHYYLGLKLRYSVLHLLQVAWRNYL